MLREIGEEHGEAPGLAAQSRRVDGGDGILPLVRREHIGPGPIDGLDLVRREARQIDRDGRPEGFDQEFPRHTG